MAFVAFLIIWAFVTIRAIRGTKKMDVIRGIRAIRGTKKMDVIRGIRAIRGIPIRAFVSIRGIR